MAEGQLQRIVGLNVARIRRALKQSQEGLADQLDVHRTYLGAVERGERNLTLKSVERLAMKLGVEPLDLLKPPPRRRSGKP